MKTAEIRQSDSEPVPHLRAVLIYYGLSKTSDTQSNSTPVGESNEDGISTSSTLQTTQQPFQIVVVVSINHQENSTTIISHFFRLRH